MRRSLPRARPNMAETSDEGFSGLFVAAMGGLGLLAGGLGAWGAVRTMTTGSVGEIEKKYPELFKSEKYRAFKESEAPPADQVKENTERIQKLEAYIKEMHALLESLWLNTPPAWTKPRPLVAIPIKKTSDQPAAAADVSQIQQDSGQTV